MSAAPRGALAVALLVVLAGCTVPFLGPDTPTPGEPTASPSPTPIDPYPPGVSEAGLENASTLLSAHVETATAAGYVATADVATTVAEGAFLVDVESTAEVAVEADRAAYHEQRRSVGGPVDRREEMWSNGTVELRRIEEGETVDYERHEPRHRSVLAGRPLLAPYLAGGNYSVDELDESGDPSTVTLVADSADDPAAVRDGLPDAAEEIRSFESRLIATGDGLIGWFEVDVDYVIAGENRTHSVRYAVERTGDVSVERRAWVDEAIAETGDDEGSESDGEASAGLGPRLAIDAAGPRLAIDAAGPRLAIDAAGPYLAVARRADRGPRTYWSRLVVSTSGWRA